MAGQKTVKRVFARALAFLLLGLLVMTQTLLMIVMLMLTMFPWLFLL